jgi:hypothetical protein
VLRSTLLYFSLLIFAIRLYGKGWVHTGYIVFCYWFSVCHIVLNLLPFIFRILFFIGQTYHRCGLLFCRYLMLASHKMTSNFFKRFLTAWWWFFSGLKHVAVFQLKVNSCARWKVCIHTVPQNAAWFTLLRTSHNLIYNLGLLGCDAVSLGEWLPTLWGIEYNKGGHQCPTHMDHTWSFVQPLYSCTLQPHILKSAVSYWHRCPMVS